MVEGELLCAYMYWVTHALTHRRKCCWKLCVCVCVCVCAGWAVDAAATGFHEGACVCVYALNWWFYYVRRNIKMCSPHEQLVRRCASGRSLKTNWRVKRKNGSNAFGARSYLNHSSCALYFWGEMLNRPLLACRVEMEALADLAEELEVIHQHALASVCSLRYIFFFRITVRQLHVRMHTHSSNANKKSSTRCLYQMVFDLLDRRAKTGAQLIS